MKTLLNKLKGFQTLRHPGVIAALGAAILFGIGTPFAKSLLTNVSPWLLAGLLYLGSGTGLFLYRILNKIPTEKMPPHEWPWLAGAIMTGGILAPVMLMFGLKIMSASEASLLLNAEGVFTTLLAWFVFRENFDKRIALGMVAIISGALILSWPGRMSTLNIWSALLVLGACLAWGIDNNLTRKVSLSDATWIAMIKGICAGLVNLTLAFWLGASFPSLPKIIETLTVGFFAYGVSLTLFVVALRHLGTARTGAYFSISPFFGAIISIIFLNEPIHLPLLIAGVLMGLGVWLHLTEHHAHQHTHEAVTHEHEHIHDIHHQHFHDEFISPDTKHNHEHTHEILTHDHPHFPDSHHQHKH